MSAVEDFAGLWDLEEADRRVLDAAERAPRLPLGDRLATSGPGTYLIRYHGAHPDYEGEAVTARPIYVGSSLSLARRLTEHRASLRAVVDLDVGDFSVACLRATSHGQALYVEERLIVLLDPRSRGPASGPRVLSAAHRAPRSTGRFGGRRLIWCGLVVAY